MTSTDQSLSDMQRAVKDAVRLHWRMFTFQGVVMIILGVLALVAPVVATIAVDFYVGWLFLISGIIGLVAMFSANDVKAFLWSLIVAALSVVTGALLLWKPAEGAMSLTLVLTAFFLAEGVIQTVTSITYRDIFKGSWGWMLLSGLSDLALAAIIIFGWPTTASWALGLIVGINLVTSGWAVVMIALAARELVGSAFAARTH